jgi:hypothetical protein
LGLTATLFSQSSILSLDRLKLRFSFNLLNISLLLSVSYLCGGCSSRLVDDLDDLSFYLRLIGVLLTFNLSDQDGTDFLCLNNCDFLGSSRTHSELILLDTGTGDLRNQVLHLAVIRTLHVSELLVLGIFQRQLLVAILLDVVGQHVLALGLFLEGLSQGLVNVDIGDVAVLENDTKVLKLLIQVLDHLACHLTLQIEDLTQPDAVDECSDTLIDFGIEKLVKAAGSQAVNEVLDLDLFTRHAEREIEIDVDIGVVLGWAVMNL